MICKNCNAVLPDDARFCNTCGQPVTPEPQQTPPAPPVQPPTGPQMMDIPMPPVKKKKGPLIAAIAAGAVVMVGIIIALVAVLLPALSGGDWLGDMQAMAGFFDGVNSPRDMSGADFSLETNLSGVSVSGSGFFDLGKDFDGSKLYIMISDQGGNVELAADDGQMFFSGDGGTEYIDADLFGDFGLDLKDLIDDKKFSPEGMADLIKASYESDGFTVTNGNISDISDALGDSAAYSELSGLWRDFCSERKSELKPTVEITKDGDVTRYQIKMKEFMRVAYDFLAYVSGNSQTSLAGFARSVSEIMRNRGWEPASLGSKLDELFENPDTAMEVVLTNANGKPGYLRYLTVKFDIENSAGGMSLDFSATRDDAYIESLDVKSSIGGSARSTSLRYDNGYLSSASVQDSTSSLNVTLSNQGSPSVDNGRLQQMAADAEEAEKASQAPVTAPTVTSPPANTPTSPPVDYYADNSYLYPSDTSYISNDYLDGCTKDEVALIRNEMYARHGYIFNKSKFRNYFGNKGWYTPLYSDANYVASLFNSVEKTNLETIMNYEKARGWR